MSDEKLNFIELLAEHFTKSFEELPDEVKADVEKSYSPREWDNLTAFQRISVAQEIDYSNSIDSIFIQRCVEIWEGINAFIEKELREADNDKNRDIESVLYKLKDETEFDSFYNSILNVKKGSKKNEVKELNLDDLFDPVTIEVLDEMFPDPRWKKWTENSSRNKLNLARVTHGKYNPYLAGEWFLTQRNVVGFDRAKLMRKLKNNLPVRSLDYAYLFEDYK